MPSSLSSFGSAQHPKPLGWCYPSRVDLFSPQVNISGSTLWTQKEVCFNSGYKPIRLIVKMIHATLKWTGKTGYHSHAWACSACAMEASTTCGPHLTIVLKWWENGRTDANRWRLTCRLVPGLVSNINSSGEAKGRWVTPEPHVGCLQPQSGWTTLLYITALKEHFEIVGTSVTLGECLWTFMHTCIPMDLYSRV